MSQRGVKHKKLKYDNNNAASDSPPFIRGGHPRRIVYDDYTDDEDMPSDDNDDFAAGMSDNIDSDSHSSFGQRIQISDRNAMYDNEEEEKTSISSSGGGSPEKDYQRGNDGDFGTSKERKSGKVNPAPGATVAKCDAQILKMNEHIYSSHTHPYQKGNQSTRSL
ncbi:hypothetical protein BGX29_000135 [Mortierella sp. GBA35]|nr:hypothetical protein BGX29_000135 [Mortierella sp. GBA35]